MTDREEMNIRHTTRDVANVLSGIRGSLHKAGLHFTAAKVGDALDNLGWEAEELLEGKKNRMCKNHGGRI